MDRLTIMLIAIGWLASVSSQAQTMVTHEASRPVVSAPKENFTGSARVAPLFEPLDSSHVAGGLVTFEPGARTAWHSHPGAQVLIITAGTGRVQRWGRPIEEVRSGDVVKIRAGEKHWHGASHESMSHIAITEHLKGAAVHWMEQVNKPSPHQGDRTYPRNREQLANPGRSKEPQ